MCSAASLMVDIFSVLIISERAYVAVRDQGYSYDFGVSLVERLQVLHSVVREQLNEELSRDLEVIDDDVIALDRDIQLHSLAYQTHVVICLCY